MDAKQQIEAELARADKARAEGNEGMARVCARRAAGLAVAASLSARPGQSAINRLLGLGEDETAPPEVRQAAIRLTARITPEHTLPFEADPLADARLIVGYFFPAQT